MKVAWVVKIVLEAETQLEAELLIKKLLEPDAEVMLAIGRPVML